jgi:hypothetical protein
MSDEPIEGEVVTTATPPKDEIEKPARRRRTVTVPAELIVQQGSAQPAAETHTPAALVALAVEKNFDIDKLERLLILQREWNADQAQKAFLAALSKFQAELPPITRSDRVDAGRAGRRKYASLGTINEAIRPYLYANGLSFRFRQHQGPDGISVTCIVSHRDGHSEETTLFAGADVSGGKNAIQSVGSTVTYLTRYTLTSALGLTTVDDDDDGEQTPAATVQPQTQAKPVAPAAPQPAASTPVVGPQKPMITGQQLAEMVSLAKSLFSSSDKFAEWLLEGHGTNNPSELTSAEADGVLSSLNMLAHQMKTPAPLPPEVAQQSTADGKVTQEQRDKIRTLTVAMYGDKAPDQQAAWLQSLGLGSAMGLTYPQAAARVVELERLIGPKSDGDGCPF